jgi:ankyrin repeat protein
MGCTSSQPDIGFDWWILHAKKHYDGITNLVEAKSETCLQPRPNTTNNLLLHALCSDTTVPFSLVQLVLAAHKEVTMIKNDSGKLPLHIACGRGGNGAATTQLILELINCNRKACSVHRPNPDPEVPNLRGNLPLHELLANGEKGVDINTIGIMLLEIHPDAVKEQLGVPRRYPLELGLLCGAPDDFLCMMLDIYPNAAKSMSSGFSSLLHWTLSNAENKSINLILKLIKAHPEAAQIKDASGQLPIHIALYKGDIINRNIIQNLLHIFPACLTIQDKKKNTPLHVACEHLHKNLSFVGGIMIECPDASAACRIPNSGGNLPIHSICEQSHPADDVALYMIDVYPDGLKIKDKDGNLPLHSAIERGDILSVDVLEKMIQVYPEACAVKDKQKNTPLHSACECRTKDLAKIVRMLLNADTNGVAAKTKDREGNLPIHSAAEKKNPSPDVVMMLIDAYPKGLHLKDRDGNLPIHSVLENPFSFPTSVVEKMLAVNPDSTKVKDKDGNTPLHSACECRTKNLPKIVKLLLDADPQAVASKTKDKDGQLPIHSACNRSKISTLVVAMLVEASPVCLEVKIKRTGIHIVQWAVDKSAFDVLQKIWSCSPHYFEAKCCKSIVSKKHETPLHYICYDKPDVSVKMMKLLAKSNAKNMKNSKGKLPLRTLYEEGRKKNLIECLKKEMGPTAFNEMFVGDGGVHTVQVVVGRK